jgi:phage/plasmid-associated DNA primase
MEEYNGPLDVFKAYTGGDTLKGSLKYVQGTFEIRPMGLVLALANQAFSAKRDSGGALARRLIAFPTRGTTRKREVLIRSVPDG